MPNDRFIGPCWRRALLGVAFVVAVIGCRLSPAQAQIDNKQPPAATADLHVEFLGPEKGFAVGAQSVTILCVIRNTGGGALPENAARVRCYPLTGLDFMNGQLWPFLPPLNPNQAVAYRWRLAVTDQTTPLVFSVLISKDSRPGQDGDGRASVGPRPPQPALDLNLAPQIAVVSIPRFQESPHLLGVAAASRSPQASASRTAARVGNDRTLVSVLAAQDRIPIISLAGRSGADWKSVAIGSPCLQVRSAEEGQVPWWNMFRWTDSDVQESKDSAILTLQGSVGANWSARITLESRLDTGVVYGKLSLMAKRTVRIYGIQLPRLLAAPAPGAGPVKSDGTAEILNLEPESLAEEDRIAAAHTGDRTYGIAWPASAPITGWKSSRLPVADSDHLPILGGEWVGDDRGEVVLAGATIETSFRLFVFGPSDTVRDALRFRIP